MKTLIALAAAAAALASTAASAADFGGAYEDVEEEAYFMEPLPRPVLIERPYNFLYEENGYYYASAYPLPYFGLFPNWRPRPGAREEYARGVRREAYRGRQYRR
ncbi:hypothetical protein [Hyphomicrobium sp.]|uniref:hypothetical protein n=1 Tax=Hyphomicrobium sp. TaxID=82 RepID=UPI002D777724|nr:hypothetical protein [Hyphomicrobium sp.]HET6388083.1 hypothetical protein [Hyphomicrobium sp.]